MGQLKANQYCETATAQRILVCLPSCHLKFESQAFVDWYIVDFETVLVILDREKNEYKLKERSRLAHI